jgi:uncharacterized DUF497 family protein
MPSLEIDGLEFDEENEEKLWSHGVPIESAHPVLEHHFNVVRNRKERRAPYIIIGTDRQGRCLALPIEPTNHPAIWRPVTGWFSKKSEWVLCP